jgi:hypothetical protein
MNLYSTCKLTIAVLLILFPVVAAIAAPDDANARRDIQHRINISGRQRMLSQRIAKAACFAALDSKNSEHIQEIREAHALFMSSMQSLKDGSAEIKLAAERDADILTIMDTANDLSQNYSTAILNFVDAFFLGKFSEHLENIYETNLPVMTAANDAVELLESKHDDGHLIRRGLANAINESGRQRMLSQKMSKELCMIASGFKLQEIRAHMLGTVALFVSSHEKLNAGLAQLKLNEKDASAIERQLSIIDRNWKELREVFIRISEGSSPTLEEIKMVASFNRTFLIELNRAVEMYEQIDTSGN